MIISSWIIFLLGVTTLSVLALYYLEKGYKILKKNGLKSPFFSL